MIVSQAKLAEIIGYSQQAIQLWQKDEDSGFPIESQGKRGSANQYDSAKVIAWLVEREVSKYRGDMPARERKDLALAQKTERENAVAEGALLYAEDAERAWVQHIVSAKSRLESMPKRVAQRVARETTPAECEKIIADVVSETLTELAGK